MSWTCIAVNSSKIFITSFFAWLMTIAIRTIMAGHDETKDTLVITVIFFIIFYQKRRHVSKLLLVLTDSI